MTDDSSLLLTLEEISGLVSHCHDPAQTLNSIVNLIQQRFRTAVCSVYLLEPSRAELVLSATVGLNQEGIGKVRMGLEEGLTGFVALEMKPIMVADAFKHPRFKYFPEAGEDLYHSYLGVPLVDGGVLNNLPVDVMTRQFSGNILAMNVAAFNPMGYGPAYEMKCPSGFEILRNRLGFRSRVQQVPSIMEILQRSATLSSQARARMSVDKVDLLLTPPIEGFRVAAFHRFDELVEIGYRYTLEALAEAENDAALKAKLWPRVAG